MKNWSKIAFQSAILSGAFVMSMSPAFAGTIKALMMSELAYSDSDVKKMTEQFEKANPDVKVELEFSSYLGLRDKALLSAGSKTGYDVILYDVVWLAEFAQLGVLKDVTPEVATIDRNQVFNGAWSSVTLGDKYFGVPWVVDTFYLYSNKKMLADAGFKSPPKTVEELYSMAKTIKDKKIAEYPIVLPMGQSEAVVCTFGTFLGASGGHFVDAQGKLSFADKDGSEALQGLVDGINQGIINPNSREYIEEDVRRVFSGGEAAFAINWSYMFNLARNPKESRIAADVGISPFPGYGDHVAGSAVNGSMGLGVSAKSSDPAAAWRYVKFLTSRETQDQYASNSLPIWKASLDSPTVKAGQEEFVDAAKVALENMIPRPVSATYQAGSTGLQSALQSALFGSTTADQALSDSIGAFGK